MGITDFVEYAMVFPSEFEAVESSTLRSAADELSYHAPRIPSSGRVSAVACGGT